MENAADTSLRTLMFNDKIDTPNLGDFLRVKEDNNNNNNLAGLTLGAVLSIKLESSSSSSLPVHSNRTLLDIIRDDPNSGRENRQPWKHFTNKLRLKPPAEAWTSNISIQQCNGPIMSRRLSRDVVPTYSEVENTGEPEISASESTRSRILEIMRVENETAEEEQEAIGVEVEDQPVRMSLMALLTENDGDGSAYMMGDEDEEEDYDELDGVNEVPAADACAGASGENNCCVCMLRQKGAAFIPCGHTFCRLCSRELWVQRGLVSRCAIVPLFLFVSCVDEEVALH
ncbi:putative protein isoform X2 [Capsicum annuum]